MKNDNIKKYQFKANKKRQVTYIQGTSYHRMLIHKFCDVQGLTHETIDGGFKNKYVCPACDSDNIIINHEYDYNLHCYNCKYGVYSENHPETKKLFTHKKVKITKPL